MNRRIYRKFALFVCMGEAGIRGYGRGAARYLASVPCQLVSQCLADFDKLELSRQTASGKRLRTMFSTGFENEGRKQPLTQDLILSGLAVFSAGRVAQSVRSVPAVGTRARSSFGRNTVGAAEAPIPKFTRHMKSQAIRIAKGFEIDKVRELVKKFAEERVRVGSALGGERLRSLRRARGEQHARRDE